MSTSLISTWFTIQLAKLGYPTQHVFWSLGYTQGDGVAFYGDISGSELIRVADRLLQGSHRAAIKRAVGKDPDLAIHIGGRRGRYHHYNSMQVEWHWYADPDHPAFTKVEKEAARQLLSAVEDEVSEVSHRLEADGYTIREAGSPGWIFDSAQTTRVHGREACALRRYRHGRFVVTVYAVEDEGFDMGHWDEEVRESELASIVSGETVYFGCVVRIRDTETGGRWGEASLWGITDAKDLRYIRGEVARELFADAKTDARERMQRLGVGKLAA